MNLRFLAKFFLFCLLASVTLTFQNCSNNLKHLQPSSIIGQKSLNWLMFAGNGEGYGGKLDGVYAYVDSHDLCGLATKMHLPVLEQIEIQSGLAVKTVENCKPLNPPQTIHLSNLQAQSLTGNLFVMNDLIYQKAERFNSGLVHRNHYINTYCQNISVAPDQSETQTIEEYFINLVRQVEHYTFNQNIITMQVIPIDTQFFSLNGSFAPAPNPSAFSQPQMSQIYTTPITTNNAFIRTKGRALPEDFGTCWSH